MTDPTAPSSATSTAATDAALAARLERLNGRRSPQPSRPPTAGGPSRPPTRPATGAKPGGGKRPTRRHAAKRSRQAALALSVAATGGLSYAMSLVSTTGASASAQAAGIVAGPAAQASSPVAAAGAATSPVGSTPAAPPSTTPAAPVTTTAPAAPVVINGDPFSNRFGTVQVQVTIGPDGSITDVATLQTPYADRQSVQINNYAVPRLNSEALTAQSASVNTISGATYTSNDYQRSLQSAIDIAVANGFTQPA
jgi:uncharacterized protein with FMN-binding domain